LIKETIKYFFKKNKFKSKKFLKSMVKKFISIIKNIYFEVKIILKQKINWNKKNQFKKKLFRKKKNLIFKYI
jgi:hypothetical protein